MMSLAALVSGILFGAGLVVSGMGNPQKVLNFLDVAAIRTGGWDPTLLCVFAGALPVMFAAYRLQSVKPWVADTFVLPANGVIDRPLVVGSTMFGIGWGLIGLCPGPAVIALVLASKTHLPMALTFFGSMLAGVWVSNVVRMKA